MRSATERIGFVPAPDTLGGRPCEPGAAPTEPVALLPARELGAGIGAGAGRAAPGPGAADESARPWGTISPLRDRSAAAISADQIPQGDRRTPQGDRPVANG